MTVADKPSSSPLVGRYDELELLRRLLETAVSGERQTVVVSGEAGIGKTALLDELATSAGQRGVRVVRANCYDLTATTAYGLWSDLARRMGEIAGLPPFPPIILESDTDERPTSRAQLFESVARVLRQLAAGAPTLIVLEDLHWADAASLDLLRVVVQRLDGLPVMLMITYRTDDLTRRNRLYRVLPQLVRESNASRIELKRLGQHEVWQYVPEEYALDEVERARLVTYLLARSEGNPLFMKELLRALLEQGTLAHDGSGWRLGELADQATPALLEPLLEQRLARLSDDTQRGLAVASAIGQVVPFDVWQAVAELGDDAIGEAQREAVEWHILEEDAAGEHLRFSHALIRDTIYASLMIPERRRLHRRIAEALSATPHPDPDVVANHFRRARDERLIPWLIQAGDRAAQAFALSAAADQLAEAIERIGDIAAPGADHGWLLYRTAMLMRYSDTERQQVAIQYLSRAVRVAESLNDDVLRAFALTDRGMLRCFSGDMRAGVPDIEQGFAVMQKLVDANVRIEPEIALWTTYNLADYATPDADGRRRILLRRGTLVTWLAEAGRLEDARTAGERFLAERDEAGNWPGEQRSLPAGVFAGLGLAYAALGLPEEARAMMTQAREASRIYVNNVLVLGNIIAQLNVVELPFFTDDVSTRRVLAAYAEEAWQRAASSLPRGGSPWTAVASVLLLEGQWAEARRVAHAEATYGNTFARPRAAYILARLALQTGDPETAMRRVLETLPDGADTELGGTNVLAGLEMQRVAAEVEMGRADLAAARVWLNANQRWIERSGARTAIPPRTVLEACWLRLAGDPTGAETAARQALALAEEPRMPLASLAAQRLLGELATERRDWDEAVWRLQAAFGLADACRAPYERALTLLSVAELEIGRGQLERAVDVLDEAEAILTPLDAAPALARLARLTTQARGTNARTGTERRASDLPAGLTRREAEVLRLIAAGHSNRDIADELSLSVRTVERHIGNLYIKIDAHSRADATAFAIRRGLT